MPPMRFDIERISSENRPYMMITGSSQLTMKLTTGLVSCGSSRLYFTPFSSSLCVSSVVS